MEDRAIPGHWEGALIAGAKNMHIATLVEGRSRFTMLVKVPGKDTVSVVTVMSQQSTCRACVPSGVRPIAERDARALRP